MSINPIPENENERLLSLGNLDLDYTDLETHFKDIVALTSKISGMEVSLINLIDPFTQWTIARHGIDMESMPREESVCQYTIMGNEPFEVPDMSSDFKFQDRAYVAGPPKLKYYFGVPLTTTKGVNIGSLCVLDPEPKSISTEKIELLKLLADEVVTKLKTYNKIAYLKNCLADSSKTQKKIAQDVRDPVAGIIGISEILIEEEQGNSKEELQGYINLINESSKLILNITDKVLVEETEEKVTPIETFTIAILKSKLEKLYQPLASNKNITLIFTNESYKFHFPIPKSEVLQIAGTLISSAINLLPHNESLTVELDVQIAPDKNTLNIYVDGSSAPRNNDKIEFHKDVMELTKSLVKELNGDLELSGNSEKLSYKLNIPFTT